jgi:hypothetical protein
LLESYAKDTGVLPVQIFGPTGVLAVLLPGHEASILVGETHVFRGPVPDNLVKNPHISERRGDRRVMAFVLNAEHE